MSRIRMGLVLLFVLKGVVVGNRSKENLHGAVEDGGVISYLWSLLGGHNSSNSFLSARKLNDSSSSVSGNRPDEFGCRCSLPDGRGSCRGDCNKRFASAELAYSEPILFGRVEARVLANIFSNGTVLAFFMYRNESDKTRNASWAEVDFEILGGGIHSVDPIQTNIITGSENERTMEEVFYSAPGITPISLEQTRFVKGHFHVLSIEWTPGYISWSFDGIELRRENACPRWGIPNKSDCNSQLSSLRDGMHLRLSLWAANGTSAPWVDSWAGSYSGMSHPDISYIDWVRIYKYHSDLEVFSLYDEDNFSDLEIDRTRWSLSTHTFKENAVHFRPENALISRNYQLAFVLDEFNRVPTAVPFAKERPMLRKEPIVFSNSLTQTTKVKRTCSSTNHKKNRNKKKKKCKENI